VIVGCCFQARVGSSVGFDSYVNISRQISDSLISRMIVPDPEVQVCTTLCGRYLHDMKYYNIKIYF